MEKVNSEDYNKLCATKASKIEELLTNHDKV